MTYTVLVTKNMNGWDKDKERRRQERHEEMALQKDMPFQCSHSWRVQ